MKRVIVIAILLSLLLLPPGTALAHGFGQRYDLPVPLWLYLYGAAATVALSFLLIAVFVGEPRSAHTYRRVNLLRFGWFRATLASRPFIIFLRLLSVALFLLVILSGLFGVHNPALNFTPTFVWIIWWVGLGFITAFIGNLWELVNPWKNIFEWADAAARWLGLENGLEGDEPYPAKWGVWPAFLLYFAFVWIEIVFEGSPTPFNIALLALLYSAITWGGMMIYGKEVWLRHGEAFSVFFGVLARFSPSEVRVTDPRVCEECPNECLEGGECINCYECLRRAEPQSREINLRLWAVGLLNKEHVTLDRLVFIVFILASVTFDGLVVTPAWVDIETWAFPLFQPFGQFGYVVFQTLGLIALPAIFLAAYFTFSFLIKALGGADGKVRQVAAAFVYSLVPIALAYQMAHYYTLLLVQGQNIFALISDPFGWGWNLFGTAGYSVNVGIVGAGFVWYSQVGLVVGGHIIAVYVAHVIALRLLNDKKRALKSQYPMLALMVLYTVSSLWILSQPVVQENKSQSASSIWSPRPTNELTPRLATGISPIAGFAIAGRIEILAHEISGK